MALVFASATHVAIALAAQGAPLDVDVPAGIGAEVARSACLSCHEADLIRQQRLTRAGWDRELDKMIRWGANVTPAERAVLLDYLAANWSPRSLDAARAAAGERGATIFMRACLACHQTDLIAQQRLERAGWVREVDKMVRWGATVTDPERESLIDYLAERFPPR